MQFVAKSQNYNSVYTKHVENLNSINFASFLGEKKVNTKTGHNH
jgi:hypothetical protein